MKKEWTRRSHRETHSVTKPKASVLDCALLPYIVAEVKVKRSILFIILLHLSCCGWQDIYFCFVFSKFVTKPKVIGWLFSSYSARKIKPWHSDFRWGPRMEQCWGIDLLMVKPAKGAEFVIVPVNFRPTKQSYLHFHLCNLSPKSFSKCTLVWCYSGFTQGSQQNIPAMIRTSQTHRLHGWVIRILSSYHQGVFAMDQGSRRSCLVTRKQTLVSPSAHCHTVALQGESMQFHSQLTYSLDRRNEMNTQDINSSEVNCPHPTR